MTCVKSREEILTQWLLEELNQGTFLMKVQYETGLMFGTLIGIVLGFVIGALVYG